MFIKSSPAQVDMEVSITQLVQLIAQAIYDKKGSNIIAIDIQDISSIAECVIIAEGNVDRHVSAIVKEIEQVAMQAGYKPTHVDGRKNGDWVVVDFGALIVHVFLPQLREKYQLERLWSKGKIVKLAIDTTDKQSI